MKTTGREGGREGGRDSNNLPQREECTYRDVCRTHAREERNNEEVDQKF